MVLRWPCLPRPSINTNFRFWNTEKYVVCCFALVPPKAAGLTAKRDLPRTYRKTGLTAKPDSFMFAVRGHTHEDTPKALRVSLRSFILGWVPVGPMERVLSLSPCLMFARSRLSSDDDGKRLLHTLQSVGRHVFHICISPKSFVVCSATRRPF